MKHVLFVCLLLVSFALPSMAQTKWAVYTDTLLAGQIHAANAASAAAIARGFTAFTLAPSDANDYSARYVQYWMRGKTSGTLAAATSFTQDTVKFQGLLVKKTAGNKIDTLWEDIGLTYTKTAINTGAGSAVYRDTTVTTFTAGVFGNANGYRSAIMKLPPYYEAYRAVNGKCDSGRVIIRWMFEPRR